MSHYSEIKVNFDQKFEKELIAALEEHFGEGQVEVHETAKALKLWNGQDSTKENHWGKANKCHVVITRAVQSKKAGRDVLSNDAGYERDADGKGYTAYIDGAGYDTKLQGLVAQSYSLRVAEKKLKAEGYMTKRVPQENGTVRLEARIWN